MSHMKTTCLHPTSFIVTRFTFFWLRRFQIKNSVCQSSSFLYSCFPQVLTVSVQEKEGRARRLGRRDPVLAVQAAGMKRKINPTFPNSQTIPKLEQNSNHQKAEILL